MKKIFLLFLLFTIVITSGIFLLSTNNERPGGEKEKMPGSPEWYDQYFQMKKNEKGIIPKDLIASIRAQQTTLRGSSTGNLLNITEIGPTNVGGRTRALLINKTNNQHLIAGGISGGIWNSYDRGKTWAPVNDFNATLSVTSIDQNPFLPNIIYYGTGESMGNSAGIAGDGVYKSIDGGLTYSKLKSTAGSSFEYIWSVKTSLSDTNTLYVGTRNNGLFKSKDGGDSFTNVYTNFNRSINDIEVFPDGSILIAVNGDGIYKSPDGEPNTFTKLAGGLPGFDFRRIELAYAKSNPSVMYAAFEYFDGESLMDIYKTTDGGSTWSKTATNPDKDYNFSFKFPWYCLTLAVSPVNPNSIIAGSVELTYSFDGGDTWKLGYQSHADYHTIVFDPIDPSKVLIGNDGGIHEYSTIDLDLYAKPLNNGYNVTQFYTGAFFPEGINIYGGTQDNGTQASKMSSPLFDKVFGGDGAFTQINQQSPNVAFVSYQTGQIKRTDYAGNAFPNFYDIKFELDGNSDGDVDDGAWFINPFEINALDGEQLYFVTKKRIWRTISGGLEWEPLTLGINSSGKEPYAVGIANNLNPTIYIGGSGGLFYRIDSAATAVAGTEKNLHTSVPFLIRSGFISSIAVHPSNDSIIYVGFSNYSTHSRIWKVSEAKSTSPKWESIGGDLPVGLPVNWIQVNPQNDSIIIAATDFGLYTTVDGGVSWQQEAAIPNVSIHMIKLRPSDGKLFIFTHGRGIWIADMPNYIPLGIKTIDKKESELSIMPNPVRDILIYKINNNYSHQYEIYDMSGRLIMNGSGDKEINVSHIKKGTYFLKIINEQKKSEVKRFVKV